MNLREDSLEHLNQVAGDGHRCVSKATIKNLLGSYHPRVLILRGGRKLNPEWRQKRPSARMREAPFAKQFNRRRNSKRFQTTVIKTFLLDAPSNANMSTSPHPKQCSGSDSNNPEGDSV
jgi:hypothetical protein